MVYPWWGMDTATKALIALAIAVWGVAGYFATTRPGAPMPEAPTAAAAASVPPPAATPAPAPAPEPPPPSPSACMASLMAPDTFGEVPAGLADLCDEPNPFKAFSSLKTAVVGASRGRMTDGMGEWGGLGWYELAALATLRARCCEKPKPLKWPFALACPFDTAMKKLEDALAGDDEAAVEKALDGYRTTATCLYKFGQGKNFGREARPGAERKTFDKMLARITPRSADAAAP